MDAMRGMVTAAIGGMATSGSIGVVHGNINGTGQAVPPLTQGVESTKINVAIIE